MATSRAYSTIVIFAFLVCASHQSPVLRYDEPEDQSLIEEEEEGGSGTIRVGDGSDVAELLEPDLATLCFAQRPDSVCFGSYLSSPHQTWSSGRGCLADAKESCDTIVVMDTWLFPSRIKYTILLPAVPDLPADPRQQEALLFRLFLTTSQDGHDDSLSSQRKAHNKEGSEVPELVEDETQYFQIFKNSTGVIIIRSLSDGESERRDENGRAVGEDEDVRIMETGFVFPSPEEEGYGELVHDPTTGKFHA